MHFTAVMSGPTVFLTRRSRLKSGMERAPREGKDHEMFSPHRNVWRNINFHCRGPEIRPRMRFLLLWKKNVSAFQCLGNCDIFSLFSFVLFLRLRRINVQQWSHSDSAPDLIEPVVKMTTNLLKGPFKCCFVALLQQFFPFLRSSWDPKWSKWPSDAGFYVISEEGVDLISFSPSSERDGSFPISLIRFSGFISICRHAPHQWGNIIAPGIENEPNLLNRLLEELMRGSLCR